MLQTIAGIPVNSMNQQTNLLANGGTAAGNVASYQYSSNAAAISTSQVVIHQQRGIPAMQANRFASQGGPASMFRVGVIHIKRNIGEILVPKIASNRSAAVRNHEKSVVMYQFLYASFLAPPS